MPPPRQRRRVSATRTPKPKRCLKSSPNSKGSGKRATPKRRAKAKPSPSPAPKAGPKRRARSVTRSLAASTKPQANDQSEPSSSATSSKRKAMDWPLVPLERGHKGQLERELRANAKVLKRPAAFGTPAATKDELQHMCKTSEERALQDAGLIGDVHGICGFPSGEAGVRDEVTEEEHMEDEESAASGPNVNETDCNSHDDDDEADATAAAAPSNSSSPSSTLTSTSTSSSSSSAAAVAAALTLKEVDEPDAFSGFSAVGECRTRMVTHDPENAGGPVDTSFSDVKTPDDMFKTASRVCEKVLALQGMDAIRRLHSNLRSSKLITLYSGLGGAELAYAQVDVATKSILGPECPGGGPSYLFACECDAECLKVLKSHKEKPGLVPNILSLVQPWAVNQMKQVVQKSFGRIGIQ